MPKKMSLEREFAYENAAFVGAERDDLSPAVISIAWRNLRYEITDFRHFHRFKPAKKVLLQRLNGFCEANTLTTLMGPSGAGKSTLLNCLSGSVTSGLTADSEIFISGQPTTAVVSYFIQQEIHETIASKLNVGHILKYAFQFKNGIGHGVKAMDDHIQRTMAELLLPEDLLERPFEQCSGGEQRRIAIAQELMALKKPQFLCIDEPTTGLDSFAALEMVKCLAQLASTSQMTIIASIHAPSSELLQHFHKLYVLAKDGVCIYSGPPNALTSDLVGSSSGAQPIETLIKVACSSLTSPTVRELADRFLTSEYQAVSAQLPNLTRLPAGLPSGRKFFSAVDLVLAVARQSRITFLAQFRQLLSQLLFLAVITFSFATFFNRAMVLPRGCSPRNGTAVCEDDILKHLLLTENISYLSLSKTNIAYVVIVVSAMFYSSVMAVFRNEHRNRWYSLSVFYLSTSIVSLLELALISVLVASVAYLSAVEQAIDDYQMNWHRFGHFTLCIFLCLLLMQSLGQLVGVAIIGSVEISIIAASILFSFVLLLDDFFFKTDELQQQFFRDAADLIAMKFMTRYLVWIFYGIGRCDATIEYSWVLVKHYADERQVGFYIFRLVVNSLVLRALTLLLLYIKFSLKTTSSSKVASSTSTSVTPIALDYPQCASIDLNGNLLVSKQNKAKRELQFQQFSKNRIIIAWRNLTLYGSRSLVELNQSVPPILRRLNGEFRFGTLTALMGVSGAGKTSLLSVINGRHHSRLSLESTFYLSRFTQIETAYIAQEVSGHLMRGLTPRQLLVYASRLKNYGHEVTEGESALDHEAIALKLLDELNLADTVDTKVENCSGGERKRLALALELTAVRMPNLVCIDEPTSGLDSSSAEMVVSTLRSLTHNHPICIIASIHQPNTELLAMFDQLYVLAPGGVCIYSGRTSKLKEHLNQVPEIALEDLPPIESLIKYCSSGVNSLVVQRLVQLTQANFLEESALQKDTQRVSDGVRLNRTRFSLASVIILSQRYLAHLGGYLWKEWLPLLVFYLAYGFNLSLFFDPAIAVPSGCFDYEADFNSSTRCSRSAEEQLEESHLQNNFKYNLFFAVLFFMIVMMQVSLALYRELEHFFNEHRNGWYSTGAFYCMRALTEIVPLLPLLCLYVHIGNIYEPVIPGIYPHLVLTLCLSTITTQALAYIVLLLTNYSMTLSMILGISGYIIMLLLSNLFNRLEQLHYAYQLLAYLSIPRWVFHQLMLLEYGGRCGARQLQPILLYMGLAEGDYSFGLVMIVFNLLFYRGIALWMLVAKVNSKRSRRRLPQELAAVRTKRKVECD